MRHGFFNNQEAMKGGEACDIHRAMKYTPVDPRWRGRPDVSTDARDNTVNFSYNRAAISVDCWDLVWGVLCYTREDFPEVYSLIFSLYPL